MFLRGETELFTIEKEFLTGWIDYKEGKSLQESEQYIYSPDSCIMLTFVVLDHDCLNCLGMIVRELRECHPVYPTRVEHPERISSESNKGIEMLTDSEIPVTLAELNKICDT